MDKSKLESGETLTDLWHGHAVGQNRMTPVRDKNATVQVVNWPVAQEFCLRQG